MKYETFSDQVHCASRQLENLLDRSMRTRALLDRMICPKESEELAIFEVIEWTTIKGVAVVTFGSPFELECGSTEYERGLLDMVKRTFPDSLIRGTSISIPNTDLI